MILVNIDIREDDLWEALEPWRSEDSKEGWRVEKVPLNVGDIAFYGSDGTELVVLERKTAEDLGASQKDGRYREQRARLLAKRGAGTSIGYVVEFPGWSASLTRSWCRGSFTELNLQNSIIRLQMRYTIPVFQASGLKETVAWIRRIATALHADESVFKGGLAASRDEAAATYTDAIHVKKSANLDSDRVLGSMLRTIPGAGSSAADAIVKSCNGSFSKFYEMSVEQISALKLGTGTRKLGPALASKIWNVFHDIPATTTDNTATAATAAATNTAMVAQQFASHDTKREDLNYYI